MTLGREKVKIITTPTPIDYLPTLSKELGIELYLKRDDMTNYGTGGNKLRKLEYFIKDAQDKGATMLLTVGGAQTNHGRLTAAVAAKYGLKSAIVAVDPYPGEISANLLLDGMLGCHVYLVKEDGVHTSKELEDMTVKKVTEEWEAKGEKVYYIPVGGSNELGLLGYYDCAVEIADQMKEMGLPEARLISTVGSMGTYLGLELGIKDNNLPIHLTGVAISPKPNGVKYQLAQYFKRANAVYNFDFNLEENDFDVTEDYVYGAYNNPVKEVRESLYHMARTEAVIMDPCYTGKTLTGLLDMARKGIIKPGETVIMLHTGGIPGIYTKHHRVEFEKELEGYIHIV